MLFRSNTIANSTASDGTDGWTVRQSGIYLNQAHNNLVIHNNLFQDIETSAVFFAADFTGSVQVLHNIIDGWNSMCYGGATSVCDGAIEAYPNNDDSKAGDVSAVELHYNAFSNWTTLHPSDPSQASAAVVLYTGSISGSGTLDADSNWWGSDTGPTIPSNPTGTGAGITLYGASAGITYADPCLRATCVATAPTALSATPSNGQLSIAFTEPSDDGGPAITSYE